MAASANELKQSFFYSEKYRFFAVGIFFDFGYLDYVLPDISFF